ncbi:Vascular endothelial growth factor receptor 1 [Dufourea novaeangliae]|uniref:Vascular endothelial growth factor receptor 1 n=1 Tax=Dufourea novaeangliae TaxID=178035 RepID=A0A154PJ68_DUFNO|nr:Vascular endothelial growth factor receptor 1 [Dufourea novaeangliae]
MGKNLMEAVLIHFEEGAVQCLNPSLTVEDQTELLPYDKKWEFTRSRLKLGKILGRGVFGVVVKAEATGIRKNEVVTTVAVKMARRKTNGMHLCALASELKIMTHLGKHLNIVDLLGACTKNISKSELLVIVEYCRFGNLHNYLLRHRGDFINQINPSTGKFDCGIGMDILTRNVSVRSNNRPDHPVDYYHTIVEIRFESLYHFWKAQVGSYDLMRPDAEINSGIVQGFSARGVYGICQSL